MDFNSDTYLKTGSALLLAFGLAACGGGGGSGSNNNGVTWPEFLDIYDTSGTWTVDLDANSTTSMNLGNGVTGSFDFDIESLQVFTVDVVNQSNIAENSCDGYPPEVSTQAEFESEDEFLDSDQCSTSSATFTELSNDSFRVNFRCDAFTAVAVFTRVSDTPEMDFGTLTFTSVDHANLDTGLGVCGEVDITSGTSTYTPQPNPAGLVNETTEETDIIVVAPWGSNEVALEFTFQGPVTAGQTFTVVQDAENAGEVEVGVLSAELGGTPTVPAYVEGSSGSVTVTGLGATSASGSFNFSTAAGDTLVGSFTFDIQ